VRIAVNETAPDRRCADRGLRFTSRNGHAAAEAEVAAAGEEAEEVAVAAEPSDGGRDAIRDVPGRARVICREHHP